MSTTKRKTNKKPTASGTAADLGIATAEPPTDYQSTLTPVPSSTFHINFEAKVAPTPVARIFNEDCIAGMAHRLADESIHLTITSIPFEELFTYSGKLEDVGNNGSTIDVRAGRFALNMQFVVEQLFRVTAPGCNVCIHIQQLLAYKNQHGFMGRRDFRGAMIEVFTAHDRFKYVGEVAIPKDPQQMAQRLNLHSLQFKTGYARTATMWAMAPNDFVLIFQKPGEIAVPVRCLQNAKDNPQGWITTDQWVKWAKGTWEDILQTDVLDGWRAARETDEEKHVCPLQLSVIYRLASIYSNPISIQANATILDPFMGIGSTAFVALGGAAHDGALREPRNVVGFELKESYHNQAERNVAKLRADQERAQAPTVTQQELEMG